jgi:membrane protein
MFSAVPAKPGIAASRNQASRFTSSDMAYSPWRIPLLRFGSGLLAWASGMTKWSSILKRMRQDARALWDESIFRSEGEPSRLYKFVHFWVLVGRSFSRNRCPIRASALSYTSLLALIPILAVAMSVTTSLLKKQGEQQIEHFIEKLVSSVMPPAGAEAMSSTAAVEPSIAAETNLNPGAGSVQTHTALAAPNGESLPAEASTNAAPGPAPDHSEESRLTAAQKKVANQIYRYVQNAQSGAIAGVGMLFLVWVAIQMLSQIESTFNDIWGVTRGRSWLMRVVLYWTTITLGPMFLIGALGLASGPHLQSTQHFISKMPVVGHFVFPLLTLVLIWLTFALLYQLVPNTKVRFSAAAAGGLVGGLLWQVNNAFGFLYVSRVVTNSKLYGGLGLVPVFMAGLYLSWLILLFGAQVAYAFQNRSLYLQERLAENVNQRGREFVALRLMTCIGQRFQRGMPPATLHEMSAELGIPSRLVQQVLQTLLAAHLVIEISGVETAYTPARPLDSINAHHILMAMRATQGQELVTRSEPVREEVYGEFARIQEAEKQTASTVSLISLVNRAQARLQLDPGPPQDEEEMKLKPALLPTQDAAKAKRPNPS